MSPHGRHPHPHSPRFPSMEQGNHQSILGKRFALEDRPSLGVGHYGAVFTGFDRQTGSVVAVKKVSRQLVAADEIFNEANVMQAVDFHPNIINYKGVFSDAHHYYLIMERADGGELYDRLTKEGLSALTEPEVQRVVRQVCSALAHLHSKGVVHGDLKPENLLLNDRGASLSSVKLADFGSSFYMDEPKLRASTTAYSAPEVLRGEACVDQKIDIWSLGVVMYILCSGSHPFDSSNLLTEDEIAVRVMEVEPDWIWKNWQGSPLALPLVKRMLSKDPAERPTAAEILRHPWFACE